MEATKRCQRCGEEHTLYYFPVRKSHPDGWVHCYPCHRELRQKTKSFSGWARSFCSLSTYLAFLCSSFRVWLGCS
jgi:hypothetical protein